ncbi:MAG: DNA alkylation repair protein [Gammaproteobacteria bacterium]|nr:DNA alkylation repair protein [Gammaproteobacteria bacterium]
MAEPFKNSFNTKIIKGMAEHFLSAWPEFDRVGFVETATHHLDALELKERSNQIAEAMAQYLPCNFEKSGEIILASLTPDDDGDISGITVTSDGIAGWAIMPMTHYVGLHGADNLELAMNLLKELTKRFTSEFGIRFLLQEKQDETLEILNQWTNDKSRHVRRLVSEGTRPRLPWAMQLSAFVKDPTPLLPLLEALKDDSEEYVRRSVANSLNDIAKDHPDLVAEIAEGWLLDANKAREKLVRHACRTLIKQGHKKALKALGYGQPNVKLNHLVVLTPTVDFGQKLIFELSLTSMSQNAQPLIIDYIIHHKKANGEMTPKVFKWKNITLHPEKTITVQKKHAIKKVTTRVYYPGEHRIEIMVNGVSQAITDFELRIKQDS